jgi:hypothetical protein
MFLINPYTYITDSGASEFIFTVDTTKAGSASDTFILPLANGTTSMTVYWGDGNSDVITTYNQAELTHVYASSGTYQISLDGSFYGIRFGGSGDCRKLMTIDNWGTNQWKTMQSAFQLCLNMTGNYSDNPDTSLCVNFSAAFRDCQVFNSALTLDASVCTTMNSMFFGALLFNSFLTISNASSISDATNAFFYALLFDQDVSAIDFSGLTVATSMFSNSSFSTTNYDLLLPVWDAYGTSSVTFHAGTAKYNTGAPATARANMISRSWTITDGGAV